MALDLREIVKQAKKMKPGETRVFQTQKQARAERQAVQDQLGDGYTVEVKSEHELTVKKL